MSTQCCDGCCFKTMNRKKAINYTAWDLLYDSVIEYSKRQSPNNPSNEISNDHKEYTVWNLLYDSIIKCYNI